MDLLGIAVGRLTYLHIFLPSTVTTFRYINNMITQYDRRPLAAVDPGYVFMDDNLHVHKARIGSQ